MSVYKPEAAKGIPMEHIYIPLTVSPATGETFRIDPVLLLAPNTKGVILGDPGSGKSTLLRFLSLSGISKPLQKRYKVKAEKRLPILVILRRYADELKVRQNLSLIDYIQESIQGDFNLKSANLDFFEYYLETGQAILLFDGLDELPDPHFKQVVRDRIITLTTTYPGNTTLITSRIVGYDTPFRFDEKDFKHFSLTRLQLPEIEQFVNDWYRVRIENPREREENVKDLIRILRDPNQVAIRKLAENPLLLTIIALVHRIDAVLPDERVILYQKCTETLLNTWHMWKFRQTEIRNRGRIERRNRLRIEAIANWIHNRSVSVGETERAVVSYQDLKGFLTTHIEKYEKIYDAEYDPEDLADEFLKFVKNRAGLLIEVGDNQYSFVHLTFQEYLTASYITTINEKEGVRGIWENIKNHCHDPRWHEVIRLLIAGLKSDESQQFLVENILSEEEEALLFQLLIGLLLDGIQPAEEHSEKILTHLTLSLTKAKDVGQLEPSITMLHAWLRKSRENEDQLRSILESLREVSISSIDKDDIKEIILLLYKGFYEGNRAD